jgi:dipeptidyl aminopeptidase/acylaminoacyl peptidase
LRLASPDESIASFRVGAGRIPEEGIPSKTIFRVAPDGRHIAIRDMAANVLRVRDTKGAEWRAEDVHEFRFSPDGQKLAFRLGRMGQTVFGVQNLELSPDGREALFATMQTVYHIDVDGEEGPREVTTLRGVHSVWFSDDGTQYLWASPERLTLHRGGKDLSFAPLAEHGTKALSVRFLADGSVLAVIRKGSETRVLRWDTAHDTTEVVLATPDPDVDADLFAGRLVHLTVTSDVHMEPIKR